MPRTLPFVLQIVLLFAAALGSASAQELYITEIMGTAAGAQRDDDGDPSDFIEIYNNGPSAVDLNGYYLSDDPLFLRKWRFPAFSLESKRFLLVYASGKNRVDPGAAFHTNFELNTQGEYLGLIAPDGVTVVHDFFPRYPAQAEDFSYGISQNPTFETLLSAGASARALVPSNDNLGLTWTAWNYNDSAWTAGTTGAGYDRNSDYLPYIGLDLRSAMEDVNTTAFVRVPFTVTDAAGVSGLVLRMRYDDGFAAYINGTLVATRNSPLALDWNASATSLHDDAAAVVFEEIDISDHARRLREGQNVLAIHGLNDNIGSSDFLVQPELEGVRPGPLGVDVLEFFDRPTPGAVNFPGYPGVAVKPTLSEPSGVFSGSFSLTLATMGGGQSIRYTTDGSDPTASSTLYSSPITISNSTYLRTRGFGPGLAPSAIVSRTYLELAANMQSVDSNLPIMVIDTFGGGISQDSWRSCFAAVVDTDPATGRARMTDEFDFAGRGGIKIRGSSSTSFPKKNYSFEVWDERDDDLNVSILGMPSESDWILHGPYSDKSLMRNYLTYLWSNRLGRYAVRSRFIELYLNTGSGNLDSADYIGTYVFMEKIKRDGDRVDVERLLGSDNTEPRISGGYILKKDRPDPGDVGFRSTRGTELRYVYPKEEDITSAQSSWIRAYIDEYEAALYGANFRDDELGYEKYIDVGSFIDHHLLVELTKNIDGYRLSTFMFKDRDGKLNMGPVWDYNLSLRNANYLEGWLPQGWYYPQLGANDYPWYDRLFQDPDFRQRYIDRWLELRRDVFDQTTLLASIDEATALLNESAARNFSRWQTLGSYVWPNPDPLARTFSEEVNLMKNWLVSRLSWIDSNWEFPPRFNQYGGDIEPGFQLTMTVTGGAAIYYTLDGTDPRRPGGSIDPAALRYSGPVTLAANTRVRARAYRSASAWSGVTDETFVTETPGLVITELLYHPADPPLGSSFDADDFEFVELRNVGGTTLDLTGFRFVDGIRFDFANGSIPALAPGDFVVIVSNLLAFGTRYDTTDIPIAGEYSGQLENAGENLELLGPLNEPIHDFAYAEDWYPETDGAGFSLVIIDPFAPRASWGDMSSWRSSDLVDGTPGVDDTGAGFGGWQLPGDGNQDGLFDISDNVYLLRALFVAPPASLPCDGAALDEAGNLVVFDLNGDLSVDVADAIYGLNYMFKSGSQPAGGETCERVEGCRSACRP